ncbi:MAG: hypothetical protein V1740_03495 [Candidatus Woesearchaeota archaeon]
MDSKWGRFTDPVEVPYFPGWPEPKRRLKRSDSPIVLNGIDIDLTHEIFDAYVDFIPLLCREGDDPENYGSSVEHDVYAFKEICHRVHYGAFYVGLDKFQKNPAPFRQLVASALESGDDSGIEKALTRPTKEDEIRDRVRRNMELAQSNSRRIYHVDPQVVVDFFDETVIKLTKKGEVEYIKYLAEHQQ